MNGFLVSNLRSEETGVRGAVIWVSAGEFLEAGSDLGPRIMVAVGTAIAPHRLESAVVILLADPPEVLGELTREMEAQVLEFATRNRDVLLRHWTGALDTSEMLDALVSARRGAE